MRGRGLVTMLCALLAFGAVAGVVPAVAAEGEAQRGEETAEDRLARLEEELRRLRAELERLAGASGLDPERVGELERQVKELVRQMEILTQELERRRMGAAYEGLPGAKRGLGPAASRVYRVDKGVSIGGYGEMVYTNFDSRQEDGAESELADTLDFLRLVLYFGYKFNDRIVFNSEIEIEHASTGKSGEVSVEFAYLDFLFRDEINVRAGMVLLPVGFVNEMHEPTVFFGALRPGVERVILPTTWRENGAGAYGAWGPLTYRAYLMAGLDAVGFTASSGIRGGRQKGSKSKATDLGLTGRLDWDIVPGLLLGVSGYLGDSGQGAETPTGDTVGGRVTLYDVHLQWDWKGLQLRGLWSEVHIDDVAEINALNGFTGGESVGERLIGWYGQAAYDVLATHKTEQAVSPYVRYERHNTQDRVPVSFSADPANDIKTLTLGVEYQPIPQVVIKLDYQGVSNAADSATDRWNVALGYVF